MSHSIRVGGYELDDAIVRAVQQDEQLLIGQEQAEQLKIEIGSAIAGARRPAIGEVAGRDLSTGLLRRASIDAERVRHALERPLAQIIDAIKDLLERTPPELSADIADRGVMLVGGGALLPGLDELIRRETGLHRHDRRRAAHHRRARRRQSARTARDRPAEAPPPEQGHPEVRLIRGAPSRDAGGRRNGPRSWEPQSRG